MAKRCGGICRFGSLPPTQSIPCRPSRHFCFPWWPGRGGPHTPVCCVPTWPCTNWARDYSLSGGRHHSQPVQAFWPRTVPTFFLRLVELATAAAAGIVRPDIVWIWTRPCSSATVGSRRAQPAQRLDCPRINPLVAVLADLIFCCTAGSRSGNCGSARVRGWNFLRRRWRCCPEKHAIRVVRAGRLLTSNCWGFRVTRVVLHRRGQLTRWLKREAARVTQWRCLDEHYAVGEFSLQLLGWDCPPPLRGHPRTTARRASLAGKRRRFPASSFRVFVTNFALCHRKKIWRDYNRRADMENRIAELKHDLAADDFACASSSPPKPPRSILLLFNLARRISARAAASPVIASPPRCAPGFPLRRSPAAPAAAWSCTCPLPGAAWRQRIPLLENVLTYGVPTSPKFNPQTAT